MTIKVLIVDDSRFFRRRLAEMIEGDPELALAGEAENGREAVQKVRELKPDVVTMDVEMPVMNGIEAVREIMKVCPTPVLMFSSLTEQGAKATLDALEAGAMDFMPKCFDDILKSKKEAVEALQSRMRELGRSRSRMFRRPSSTTATASSTRTQGSSLSSLGSRSSLGAGRTSLSGSGLRSSTLSSTSTGRLGSTFSSGRSTSGLTHSTLGSTGRTGLSGSTHSTDSVLSSRPSITDHKLGSTAPEAKPQVKHAYNSRFSLLAIGSSTGGPVALQTLLTALPGDLPVPVVVVQHMPASFTGPFAQRLNQLCQLTVSEAVDGELMAPGHVYIAPGGRQMLIESGAGGRGKLHIVPSPPGLNYKPCVDITFGSAAQMYKGRVLSCILTGMGADGRKGCGLLHENGAVVFAQNEESCVIYGMPKAVVDAGIADQILDISDMADGIVEEFLKK